MVDKTNKNTKKKETRLSATEDEPLKNLLILLLLIPLSPIIILFYLATGRTQNSFILGSGVSIIIFLFSAYGFYKYSTQKEYKYLELTNMISDLPLDEREKLAEQFSTLRESLGGNKLPEQYEPILDSTQNMLAINYYNYLVNSGLIGDNGSGGIYMLQNSLYSQDIDLAKASWKTLRNINTAEAKIIMSNFKKHVEEKVKQNPNEQKILPKQGTVGKYQQKFDNKINIIKNKINNW